MQRFYVRGAGSGLSGSHFFNGLLNRGVRFQPMCLDRLHHFMFKSTGLGSGHNVEAVRETLRTPVLGVQSPQPHIAVLDTANGGHGASALAKVLKQLWRDDGRPWNVQFHLLAARDSRVGSGSFSMFDLTEPKFACSACIYPVDSLLVEDWDPAYGLRLADPDRTTLKPLDSPTYRIAVSQGSSVYVVESQAPYDAINKMIANSVTEAITTDPGLVQTRDLTKER